jgi:hypothetical protein
MWKADGSAKKLRNVTTHAGYRRKHEVTKYTREQLLGENAWPSTTIQSVNINRLRSL